MELVGAISEGEWSSLYGMYSEEADFMAQLLLNYDIDSNFAISSSSFLPSHESTIKVPGIDDETKSIRVPEGYYPGNSHQIFATNNSFMSIDYCSIEGEDNSSLVQLSTHDCIEWKENLQETVFQGKSLQLGREHGMPISQPCEEDKVNTSLEILKKRPRNPREVQKNKRSMKKKRVSNLDHDEDNTNNAVLHRQSSSSCCSEEESNASHELNGGVSSSSNSKGSGKTRASRGSATDPQSLYARKRRERINERLRILQNLVPNGTKVDISTMLEEAVQYVKFLQLQIKLLSSDDLWMYAPIAYNGMDIGRLAL